MAISPSTINSLYQQGQINTSNPYFNRARYQTAWEALLADQRAEKERLARLAIAKKAQALDQRLTEAQLAQMEQNKMMSAVKAPFEAFKTGREIYKQGQELGAWGSDKATTRGPQIAAKPTTDIQTMEAGGINYAKVENPYTGEKTFQAIPEIYSDPKMTSPGLSVPGQLGAGMSLAPQIGFTGLSSLYSSPAATNMPLTAPTQLSVPASQPAGFTGMSGITGSPAAETMPLSTTSLGDSASAAYGGYDTAVAPTNYSAYAAAFNPANRYADYQMGKELLNQSVANEGLLSKMTPFADTQFGEEAVGGATAVGGGFADYFTGGLFSAAKPGLYKAFGPVDEFMGDLMPFDINSIFG